jgi:hypothetical protein
VCQIHTTGTDLPFLSTFNARAVQTLGKDMVWRDYVQGAWRMRRLARGHTIHLLVSPLSVGQSVPCQSGTFQSGDQESVTLIKAPPGGCGRLVPSLDPPIAAGLSGWLTRPALVLSLVS